VILGSDAFPKQIRCRNLESVRDVEESLVMQTAPD
jgi:hypothetical protein